MLPLVVFLLLTALWLAYLAVERIRLDRHREAIPLRIAVTGTRGKTSVTRMLAAVLAEDGRAVLAKSTGSEAAYLFPDGTVQEVNRRGAPSIIEQKRLIRRGAKLGVDAVVAEIMSVHEENHRVEAHRLIRPHLTLATNFRVDHRGAHGASREGVASLLALDVPPGAKAMVPEKELEPSFQRLVEEGGGNLETVPTGSGQPPEGWRGFDANLDLVWAAARTLGVEEDVISRGLTKVRWDLGALRAWSYPRPESRNGDKGAHRQVADLSRATDAVGDRWLVVNAFAANDPESTLAVYDRVASGEGFGPEDCAGLLCLRSDRGDRTLQWAEALEEGALGRFRRLFVVGLHANALRHRLRRHPDADRVRVLRHSAPQEVMGKILGDAPPGLVFGFGNIGGAGETLVRHWRRVGKPHGI